MEKSVAFDFDLTLVDTSEAIKKTIIEVLSNFQIKPNISQLQEGLHLPLDEVFRSWEHEIDIEYAKNLYMNNYFDICTQGAKLLPGVEDSLTYLSKKKIKVIIVSAKKQKNLDKLINYFGMGIYDCFGDVFLESKVSILKKKNSFVYIGDHLNDVQVARNADCTSVITLTGHLKKDDFVLLQPDKFLEDLSELPQYLDVLLGNMG
jgi:phosphoglycolate phosphatase-like HAD superfamily hydrolase